MWRNVSWLQPKGYTQCTLVTNENTTFKPLGEAKLSLVPLLCYMKNLDLMWSQCTCTSVNPVSVSNWSSQLGRSCNDCWDWCLARLLIFAVWEISKVRSQRSRWGRAHFHWNSHLGSGSVVWFVGGKSHNTDCEWQMKIDLQKFKCKQFMKNAVIHSGVHFNSAHLLSNILPQLQSCTNSVLIRHTYTFKSLVFPSITVSYSKYRQNWRLPGLLAELQAAQRWMCETNQEWKTGLHCWTAAETRQ